MSTGSELDTCFCRRGTVRAVDAILSDNMSVVWAGRGAGKTETLRRQAEALRLRADIREAQNAELRAEEYVHTARGLERAE